MSQRSTIKTVTDLVNPLLSPQGWWCCTEWISFKIGRKYNIFTDHRDRAQRGTFTYLLVSFGLPSRLTTCNSGTLTSWMHEEEVAKHYQRLQAIKPRWNFLSQIVRCVIKIYKTRFSRGLSYKASLERDQSQLSKLYKSCSAHQHFSSLSFNSFIDRLKILPNSTPNLLKPA